MTEEITNQEPSLESQLKEVKAMRKALWWALLLSSFLAGMALVTAFLFKKNFNISLWQEIVYMLLGGNALGLFIFALIGALSNPKLTVLDRIYKKLVLLLIFAVFLIFFFFLS